MKYINTILILCLFSFNSIGQAKKFNKTLSLSAGPSFAGSGDLTGFYFQLGAAKKVGKWNYSINQTTTIHDGSYTIFSYEYPSGSGMQEASIRYSVTGLQLTPAVGYSIVLTKVHDLQFSLGAVIRYQSNGDNDAYSIYHPAATGFPVPVLVFDNRAKLRTFSIGPIGQISHDFYLNDRWAIGGLGSFQFDTNGDTFLNYGLRLGYKF